MFLKSQVLSPQVPEMTSTRTQARPHGVPVAPSNSLTQQHSSIGLAFSIESGSFLANCLLSCWLHETRMFLSLNVTPGATHVQLRHRFRTRLADDSYHHGRPKNRKADSDFDRPDSSPEIRVTSLTLEKTLPPIDPVTFLIGAFDPR